VPDVQVLLAVQGPGEADLVTAITRSPGLAVSRRCGDVAELLAAAGARIGSVAVISASHLGIDRVVVDRLRQMGVLTVGLASPEDTERVAALGVDAVVDHGGGTPAVLAALAGVRDLPPPPPPHRDDGAGAGTLVTVWGTAGAPGRTVVATNLAHALTRHGSVGLVDADTRAPSVAQVLGMVDESSSLAIAVRAATQGRLDDATFDRCFPRVGGIAVMSGLTRPDRWREVPAAGLEVVLDRVRSRFTTTVVDVTGGWEPEAPGFDSAFAPARDAAQVAALRASDVVVIVGTADPVGIHRLITLLADRPRAAGREVVVVTRVRRSVGGPAPGSAVREALSRFAGVTDPVLVDDDRAGLDSALMAGDFLATVAPRSPALRGIEELARVVAGVPASRRAARPARRGRR
jgi:MinD-like ATPase involved in chromosome partitioning or flagellar assembly